MFTPEAAGEGHLNLNRHTRRSTRIENRPWLSLTAGGRKRIDPRLRAP